jgi:hypothetical protein
MIRLLENIFAEQIVRPGVGKIDFSGFEPILHGISKAVAHYQAKLVATDTPAAKFA